MESAAIRRSPPLPGLVQLGRPQALDEYSNVDQ
jgi:hypothetical protein